MVKYIRHCDVTDNGYGAYHQTISSFPHILLGPGIFGVEIFVGEEVAAGRYLIEYTENRIRGSKSRTMHRALDCLDRSPDVFVNVS